MRDNDELIRNGPASKSHTPQLITNCEGSYKLYPLWFARPDGESPVGTYTNAQATPGGTVLEPGARATDTRKFLTVMLADTPLTELSLPLRTITLASY